MAKDTKPKNTADAPAKLDRGAAARKYHADVKAGLIVPKTSEESIAELEKMKENYTKQHKERIERIDSKIRWHQGQRGGEAIDPAEAQAKLTELFGGQPPTPEQLAIMKRFAGAALKAPAADTATDAAPEA